MKQDTVFLESDDGRAFLESEVDMILDMGHSLACNNHKLEVRAQV
jgi:hypothetical protein